LFDDPFQRKRRKTNGKEDALYGVFAEEIDEESSGGKRGGRSKRNDWTKAPAFISGEKKVDLDKEMEDDLGAISDINETADDEDIELEGKDEVGEDEEYANDSEPTRPPSPRVWEDEPLEPHSSSIGLRSSGLGAVPPSHRKGGIGSSTASRSVSSILGDAPPPASTPTSNTAESLPSAFGNRGQRSFVRDADSAPKLAVPLTAEETAHFNKLQGTFGARMLSKMGWKAGTGLGISGEGIATPVDGKMRPQKMGLAFKGFKERTDQSIREARRRGEVVSDEEDTTVKKLKKKVREQEEKRSDVWKRPRKVKTKIEHKAYEQIVAEAGEELPAAGIGQIIDATGAIVSFTFYTHC
jgi:tuftelin-interacting protein 11